MNIELCPCGSGRNFDQCHNDPQMGMYLKGQPIRRQDAISIAYRKSRHLQYLSDDELFQRTEDIMANFLTIDKTESGELKFRPHSPDIEEGRDWMVCWIDVLEEWLLRGHIFPEPFQSRSLDRERALKIDWPGLGNVIPQIEKVKAREQLFLVKYGLQKFMVPMIERGIVRISPASSYDDPSLNQAIRDDELASSIFTRGEEVTIQTVDERTLEPTSSTFSPIGNVVFTFESLTNYYVYCLAHELSYRMFGDFEYDCCVVINDPKGFQKKLAQAFHQQLPHYQVQAGLVSYFDPAKATAAAIKTGFSKHFKYSYQREYRMIWIPEEPQKKLEAVFLELGSLKDCCEMITL